MTTTPTTADRLGGTAAESALSDADGPTDVPLLEETIGDNFDRTWPHTVARDALVEYATRGAGPTRSCVPTSTPSRSA